MLVAESALGRFPELSVCWGRQHCEGLWPLSGRYHLKSLGHSRCVSSPHQRPPTQQVVGHGDKEHDAGDFGKSS